MELQASHRLPRSIDLAALTLITLTLLLMASIVGATPLEIDAGMTDLPERAIPEPPVAPDKATAAEALAVLARADYAATSRLEALERWNLERRKPIQTGFVRPFDTMATIDFGSAKTGQPGVFSQVDGATVWSARVEVERAHRVRLHLAEVELPAGTQMWVRGGTELVAFDKSLRAPAGNLWTPSIGGDSIELIVELPAGFHPEARIRIDAVAEIFRLDSSGAPRFDKGVAEKEAACLEDGACYGTGDLAGYDIYQEAVSNLSFVDGGDTFSCTGTLVNDSDPSSFIPYLLTANHCFSTQAVASTLEAFFDDIALSCGNMDWPDLGSLPRVNGSTLRATNLATDSTFVQLAGNPSGPTGFMGWSTAVATAGTTLYRLSHPMGLSQHFAVYQAVNPGQVCEDVPLDSFIYSDPILGGSDQGSSGASLVDGNIRIRGQLLGACGPDPADPCNPGNDDLDGRFAEFFDQIAGFLLDDGGSTGCTSDANTLCMLNDRFQVTGTWRDFENDIGPFEVTPVDLGDRGGAFHFFSPNNPEVFVKVIDGCTFNGHFWFFAAGLTNLETVMTVVDTQTNTTQTYTNTIGQAAPAITDTEAFATCP